MIPIISFFSSEFANPELIYSYEHVNLWYCHIHNVFEICVAEPYRVCFECSHVYNKPSDLEAAYSAVVAEMNTSGVAEDPDYEPLPTYKPAEVIYFCQECIHDF